MHSPTPTHNRQPAPPPAGARAPDSGENDDGRTVTRGLRGEPLVRMTVRFMQGRTPITTIRDCRPGELLELVRNLPDRIFRADKRISFDFSEYPDAGAANAEDLQALGETRSIIYSAMECPGAYGRVEIKEAERGSPLVKRAVN